MLQFQQMKNWHMRYTTLHNDMGNQTNYYSELALLWYESQPSKAQTSLLNES